MKRTTSSILRAFAIMMALFMAGLVNQTATAEKYASIVIDADTHEVLHARNADEARYPASLTKVMTMYMLFDALKSGEVSLDERLVISRHAASQAPSNLKLRTGSTISVKDAIGALVTKSANDVAVVVAERLGGTESRFAQLMTIKAKSLGLEHTRFKNASGLPDTQQITTARDLAILAEAMLEDHADYYHYFSNSRFTWAGKTYKNHNELLGVVEGVDGIKTGYTRASGFNLMASAKRDGHRVIAIMLGGSTSRSRNAHVEDLIEAAFTSYDAPEHNLQLAFANVTDPLHPNDAAEPMLNGKRLSVIMTEASIAQGDEGDVETPEILVAQPEIVEAETVAMLTPTPEPVTETQPAVVEKTQTMTVAEYQARQLRLAK